MKRTSKLIALLVALSVSTSLFAGCGDKTESSSAGTSTASASVSSESTSKEPVVIKYAGKTGDSTNEQTQALFKFIEEGMAERGMPVKMEAIEIPGENVENEKKLVISLMAGDKMDLLYLNTSTGIKYSKAKLIMPIDDLVKESNYDIEGIYGSTAKKFDDKLYMIPTFKDVHVTLYNKKMFDDAGIAYPDNATWTWDKYVEAAKKLTNSSKGKWGSFMIYDWDPYPTFIAKQKKVPVYKEDGTSNFDDAGWAETFKFCADLGNVQKVQPDVLTSKSKSLPFDSFISTDNYGLFTVGNWFLTTAADRSKYPRDWNMGIAIMPQVKAGEKVTLGITGGWGIPITASHSKEAFEILKFLGEDEWKFYKRIPARVNLTAEEQEEALKSMVDSLKDDGITKEELVAAIMDPALDVVDEKIFGVGGSVMNTTLIPQTLEMYATGQSSLEDAMKNLKEKADKAIKDDNSAK